PPMVTPERDFWPLMPRPAVLPLPEPGPRATRLDFLAAPGLSRSSCSFMSLLLGRKSPASDGWGHTAFLDVSRVPPGPPGAYRPKVRAMQALATGARARHRRRERWACAPDWPGTRSAWCHAPFGQTKLGCSPP